MEKLNKTLAKYFFVIRASWQEHLVYRVNFLLWRFRAILYLLVLYFLWSSVFRGQDRLFGYTASTILTYILGTSIIRSFVLSSQSASVAGEILGGQLSNLLLRPFSYIGYWFAKDIADKTLNILFVFLEIAILLFFLRPPVFIQFDPMTLLLTFLTTILALVLFFYMSFLISLMAFWVREVWAPRFLIMILLESLSGVVFPLDILPAKIFAFLKVLPFTYLVFFPLKIYLGQIDFPEIWRGMVILSLWLVIIYFAAKFVWRRGLRVYAAEGQ